MQERPLAGGLRAEMRQGSLEQVVQLRAGVLGFGCQVDELDEIRGQLEPPPIETDLFVRLAESRLPQAVDLAAPAAGNLDFAEVKEIERAGEPALRAASPLGVAMFSAFPPIRSAK